jgi:hypothetical protein
MRKNAQRKASETWHTKARIQTRGKEQSSWRDEAKPADLSRIQKRLLLQNEPTVEIFHEGLRAASRARSFVAVQATTIPEHRPKAHQQYLEWTPSRLLSWADAAGPHTAQLFRQILATKPASGNGLPFLPRPSAPERQKHTTGRLEAAATRAPKA